jgi:hypothetical protein
LNSFEILSNLKNIVTEKIRMLNFLNLRIMKAKNLLKILFSLVAFLMVSSAFSQITYPGNLDQGTATDVDSVTAGVTVPYYVEPDPVLNDTYTGTYVPTDGAASDLNPDEYWDWILLPSGPGATLGTQGEADDGTANGPYQEVTWNAPGGGPVADSIYVAEYNNNVGCIGDTSVLGVLVFAQPEFTPIDNGDGNTETDEFIELCGTQDYNINLASITDNGVDAGNWKIRFDVSVDNVLPSAPQGASQGNIRTSTDSVVVLSTPNDGDLNAETNITMVSNYNIRIENNDVTRYRFSFGGNGTDGDPHGISDMVSRKSDYLNVGGNDSGDDNEWTYYAPS